MQVELISNSKCHAQFLQKQFPFSITPQEFPLIKYLLSLVFVEWHITINIYMLYNYIVPVNGLSLAPFCLASLFPATC